VSVPGFRARVRDTDVAVTFRDLILLPGWTEVEPGQVRHALDLGPGDTRHGRGI